MYNVRTWDPLGTLMKKLKKWGMKSMNSAPSMEFVKKNNINVPTNSASFSFFLSLLQCQDLPAEQVYSLPITTWFACSPLFVQPQFPPKMFGREWKRVPRMHSHKQEDPWNQTFPCRFIFNMIIWVLVTIVLIIWLQRMPDNMTNSSSNSKMHLMVSLLFLNILAEVYLYFIQY